MTAEMTYLMYLYAQGARGVSPQPPDSALDRELLLQLAKKQGIYNDVLFALKSNPELPFSITMKGELLGACLQRSKQVALILALLAKMEQAGLHPVVLKGFDNARFYACPEARCSADTDLLIPPEEEAAAQAFLTQEGFKVKPRRVEQNHSECIHPVCGLIELHISLFSPLFAGTVFAEQSLTPKLQTVSLPAGSYRALDDYEALLFTALHLIKHFLFNGINLRMLMDTGLRLKSCTKEQQAAVYTDLQRLGFGTFMSAVCALLVRYCGFSELPDVPPCSEEQLQALVDDLELACWQPDDIDAEQLESWYILRNRRLRKADGQTRQVYAQQQSRERRSSLFPTRRQLAKKYPSLDKYAVLYPFCWLHRLFAKGLPYAASRRRSARNPSPETQRRLELFSRLDIGS